MELENEFQAKSDRVKSISFHHELPWILASLHSGSFQIWDLSSHSLVMSIQVADTSVRCAKFLHHRPEIITGCDDCRLRLYAADSGALLTEWEGHLDFIRFIDVHPTKPLILSASDDQQVKLWDGEPTVWTCMQAFTEHSHYVMMAKFAPSGATFASCSLDASIKVWSIDSPSSLFTLTGHTKGINCLDFFTNSSGQEMLVSGADDKTVKVWDLASRSCRQTLEGHTNHVSCVCLHLSSSLIFSVGEDGILHGWKMNATAAAVAAGVGEGEGEGVAENDFDEVPMISRATGLERGWRIASGRGGSIVVGCDGGLQVMGVGGIQVK